MSGPRFPAPNVVRVAYIHRLPWDLAAAVLMVAIGVLIGIVIAL